MNITFEQFFNINEKLAPIYRIYYKNPHSGDIKMLGNRENNKFFTGAAAGSAISELEYIGRFPKNTLIVKMDGDDKEPKLATVKVPTSQPDNWMHKWESKND